MIGGPTITCKRLPSRGKGTSMGNRVSNGAEVGRLQSMSRRGFIGAAGTALAVGALAGTVQAHANEPASGLPSAWDYEAEVVICGFGGAGAMAAKEAVACGLSHIVFEKAPEQYAGGATTCCAGVCNATTNVEALVASSMGYMTEEAAHRTWSMQRSRLWTGSRPPARSLTA